MAISIQRFLLLTIGLLFCVLGCTRERVDVRMLDDPSDPMAPMNLLTLKLLLRKTFCLFSRRGVRSSAAMLLMAPMVWISGHTHLLSLAASTVPYSSPETLKTAKLLKKLFQATCRLWGLH